MACRVPRDWWRKSAEGREASRNVWGRPGSVEVSFGLCPAGKDRCRLALLLIARCRKYIRALVGDDRKNGRGQLPVGKRMRALVLGERSRKRDGSFFFVDQFPTKRADFTSTLSSENEKLYDRAEGESGRTRLQEYLHELVIGENTIAAHKLGRRSEAVTGAALKIFAPHAPLHKYLDGDQCLALFRGVSPSASTRFKMSLDAISASWVCPKGNRDFRRRL